jgi:hypothetical protein
MTDARNPAFVGTSQLRLEYLLIEERAGEA